jgi:DNA polymerase-3 subunit epsilon
MKYLVFDTETTGMVEWKLPHTDPSQPKLVQLGCLLFDAEHNEINALKTLVVPLAPIHEKAFEAHGISFETAETFGVSNENVMEMFCDFVDIADAVVCHNTAFDVKVMKHAAYNAKIQTDIFAGKAIRCTKEATTKILRLPSPFKKNGYKWPSLQECAQYFFKEDVVGAHDAMVDVTMTARVYRSLVENFEIHELKWQ